MIHPHKLGKEGPKRCRTVAVRQLNTSLASSIEQIHVPIQHHYAHISGNYFSESQFELFERNKIFHEVFCCMLIKVAAAENDMVICDILHFIAPHTAQSNVPSKIHYMELINENADSDDTMLHVTENLLELFDRGHHNWVLLAADGKSYQHTLAIKQKYGESLKKLLLMPGDWHTLKNYQETLMKIFFSAGLQEIAIAAGFKGATLTSLQKSGNTHVQKWKVMLILVPLA